jgi:hypothetical protein
MSKMPFNISDTGDLFKKISRVERPSRDSDGQFDPKTRILLDISNANLELVASHVSSMLSVKGVSRNARHNLSDTMNHCAGLRAAVNSPHVDMDELYGGMASALSVSCAPDAGAYGWNMDKCWAYARFNYFVVLFDKLYGGEILFVPAGLREIMHRYPQIHKTSCDELKDLGQRLLERNRRINMAYAPLRKPSVFRKIALFIENAKEH